MKGTLAGNESRTKLRSSGVGASGSQIAKKALYVGALFLSATLLFLIQPMVGKMVLPRLGGSPSVWVTCMVSFQAALLGGYIYAHLIATRLPAWLQVVAHLALLIASALCLPVSSLRDRAPPQDSHPVGWLLVALSTATGLPFLAVSASAPLLQRWYASNTRPRVADPYFLYSASNAGSMLGLLGYPVLMEPNLTLVQQAVLWAGGYALLIAMIALCGWLFWRSSHGRADLLPARALDSEAVGPWQRARWVVLAFAPSSLMLGVTTVLTTDIPPVPMLWVGPLALYLLSFVLVFGNFPGWARRFVTLATPLAISGEAYLVVIKPTLPLGIQIAAHLATFFIIAMACHGELARTRPPLRHLTDFYLWLAVGGMLGGAFNALIAPAVFSSIVELPITLIAASLLMPRLSRGLELRKASKMDVVLPACLGVLAAVLLFSTSSALAPAVWGILTVACLALATHSLRFGLGIAALFLANLAVPHSDAQVLFQERSFFGVSRVVVGNKKNVHWYMHGHVEHGGQALSDDPAMPFAPFLYYDPYGPIGQVFLAQMKARSIAPVGVIGLGCGCLAYYGQPGQPFTFYEIDPVVKRIAEDPAYFTFLRDCDADCRVVLGDARLSLEKEPDGTFGLLVLDAFTGDTIPVHLLTAEAVELYLKKLAPDGAIAFHISNNYFELEPVIAAIAAEKHLCGLSRRDRRLDLTEADVRRGRRPSHWLLLSQTETGLKWVAIDPRWKPLTGRPRVRAWTDDYSNLLSIIR